MNGSGAPTTKEIRTRVENNVWFLRWCRRHYNAGRNCYRGDQCSRYIYVYIGRIVEGHTRRFIAFSDACTGKRGHAIFFYQTRKPSVRVRGGIEGYTRLAFFHAVLLRRRNRINQRNIESRAISSKCVWIAMDARIEPVSFAQMGDF